MYAIIQTGGKQYEVKAGDRLEVEKLPQAVGEEVLFETLLVGNSEKILIGQPSLGQKVSAKVLEETKGEKLIAYKYKRRKGFDKKLGHRQRLTLVEIKEITV